MAIVSISAFFTLNATLLLGAAYALGTEQYTEHCVRLIRGTAYRPGALFSAYQALISTRMGKDMYMNLSEGAFGL